ncbi:hypothetical protein A6R68_11214 [Neotoma lepida]|uniref:Ubiquitin-like protease family profile domain-containing protein n=1 Tax=Neotoma lepida TaxID=56216 RepID=A0A1A6FUM9_NEOLE|nr:hypothetical protein A6R68_11214 [Neotoma lepida]
MEHTPISRKRKKRVRSNIHDSHNSKSSLDKSPEYIKEEENDLTVSSKLKQSSDSCHRDPAPTEGLTPEPLESEATNVCSLAVHESDVSAASGRVCSPTRSSESSVSHNEVEGSSLAEKDPVLTVKEKSLVGGNSEENQLLISVEPIVVSSDEEGPTEHKNSAILKLQPSQDYEIASENQGPSEAQLSELPLSACESVQTSSELCPYKPDMENISCIKPNSEMDLKLDFVFTSVYIDTVKPTYTFVQKQSSGCYSLSITSSPDEEWREVRHTGPVQKMAQRRHKRVRTWTRHINIFNKDYIFVPVNESSHWYLAVICFPWLEEAVYEDFPQPVSQQPQDQQSQQDSKTIDNDLHTTSTVSASAEDSQSTEMNMSVPKKMCKRYLEVEWEVKRKTHREFSKTSMVDLCPKVPKQDNSSDCGVYLLQYVESFFQDPIVNFELPIHLEKWFPRHVIKTKREDIRELILKLHLQQQKGSSS